MFKDKYRLVLKENTYNVDYYLKSETSGKTEEQVIAVLTSTHDHINITTKL